MYDVAWLNSHMPAFFHIQGTGPSHEVLNLGPVCHCNHTCAAYPLCVPGLQGTLLLGVGGRDGGAGVELGGGWRGVGRW